MPTEDELNAAVLAERARCVRVAEGWLTSFGDISPQHVSAQAWASDAVRDIVHELQNPTATH